MKNLEEKVVEKSWKDWIPILGGVKTIEDVQRDESFFRSWYHIPNGIYHGVFATLITEGFLQYLLK
jgi:hypothetical protein